MTRCMRSPWVDVLHTQIGQAFDSLHKERRVTLLAHHALTTHACGLAHIDRPVKAIEGSPIGKGEVSPSSADGTFEKCYLFVSMLTSGSGAR